MPTTIIVPQSRPPIPPAARTHWRVDVQAAVIGGFADVVAHLAAAKFRLATHRFIDWKQPATDTILQSAPVAGPTPHRIWWECSPFATHVGLIFGYQAFSASSTPTISADLLKLNGDAVDDAGVLWSTADGSIEESSEYLRTDGGGPVYTYPIQYTSTARVVDPGAVVGVTGPRLFNVGGSAGQSIRFDVSTAYARVHLIVGFEATFNTVTQG